MSTVVASWNVHSWIGSDGRGDLERAFAVVRALDADVVALQEVADSDWQPLAHAAGYATRAGPTRDGFGNALLARVEIVGGRLVDLSVDGREPRGALDATVDTDAGRLRVVATHLGLRAAERRRQAERLAEHLEADRTHLPTVLLGDLNDWTPWGGQLRPLARAVGPLSRVRTFPSRRPLLALDRAAHRNLPAPVAIEAVRTPAARLASDHLPLRVAFG